MGRKGTRSYLTQTTFLLIHYFLRYSFALEKGVKNSISLKVSKSRGVPLKTRFINNLYYLQIGKIIVNLLFLNSKEKVMPKVSSKRQITLPIAGCEALGINPGDEVEILRYKDQFNIIKKISGSAKGLLKGVKANTKVSDKASLQSQFE